MTRSCTAGVAAGIQLDKRKVFVVLLLMRSPMGGGEGDTSSRFKRKHVNMARPNMLSLQHEYLF